MDQEVTTGAQMQDRLEAFQPSLINDGEFRFASVALVIRETDVGPQILFIERARKKSDPWSGQVAFPGGNRDPGDADVMHTAIRETREEVGLRLLQQDCIGRLDDQQGRTNYQAIPLAISCFVFRFDQDCTLVNNYEVADSFWTRLDHLQTPGNRISYQTDYSPEPYPGVKLDSRRVLWGLTYRFVENFLSIMD